jgi:hypothetical protein
MMAGSNSVDSATIRAEPLRWLLRVYFLVFALTAPSPTLAGQARLEWDASTSVSVAGYYVYYGQASRNYPAKVDAGFQTTYAVPGLIEGQTYYFAVTAYDTDRVESAYSNEVIATIPPVSTAVVVEFYNATLDHYFISVSALEISDLDNGVHLGWARTGYSFKAWDAGGGFTNPVCRYYIPPGFGDSHFFSAAPDECAIALVKFPQLVKETDAAFYITLPDKVSGVCAVNEVPVYRLWNGRSDSNHRYTTSTLARAMMIAAGYVAEGYGPEAVAMCASK